MDNLALQDVEYKNFMFIGRNTKIEWSSFSLNIVEDKIRNKKRRYFFLTLQYVLALVKEHWINYVDQQYLDYNIYFINSFIIHLRAEYV